MRISNEQQQFFKQVIGEKIPGSRVFLFGSRVDDNKKGGDIDILILSEALVERPVIWDIKKQFYEKFGEQKLDLVNYTFADDSAFKTVALSEGVEL